MPTIAATSRVALAALVLAASAGFARADAFSFTAVDTPISANDEVPITSTLVIGTTGLITDLNVFLDVTTQFAGDVIITLTHVDTGTAVILFNQVGGAGDNITNITYDDEAASPIGGTAPFGPGTFQPFASLTAFDGEDIGGTWTLGVVDVVNDGGNTHSIQTFQLFGDAVITPEPGTWALFGLGGAGLLAAVRRRRRKAAVATTA